MSTHREAAPRGRRGRPRKLEHLPISLRNLAAAEPVEEPLDPRLIDLDLLAPLLAEAQSGDRAPDGSGRWQMLSCSYPDADGHGWTASRSGPICSGALAVVDRPLFGS
jgi:hypothetical protein